MGLISPGGENLVDFRDLGQVLSTYDGDLRDPLLWPQERPVPKRVARGPFGIPLPTMPGPKSCVESVPEPEDSFRVETVMSANFFSFSKCVKDPLEVPEVGCG